MSEKASFEAREPHIKGGKYTGMERRQAPRRSEIDRRTNVRFELNAGDRRENHGRRCDDNAPVFR